MGIFVPDADPTTTTILRTRTRIIWHLRWRGGCNKNGRSDDGELNPVNPDSDGDGFNDPDDECQLSDLNSTVVIGVCSTGVSNTCFHRMHPFGQDQRVRSRCRNLRRVCELCGSAYGGTGKNRSDHDEDRGAIERCAANLSPDTAGMLKTDDMTRFLSLTEPSGHTRLGDLAMAKWLWGSPALLDSREPTRIGSSSSSGAELQNTIRITLRNSQRELIAITVPKIEFERWFWCGMSLYDRYNRFIGYGCHPEWGPDQPDIVAPWVQKRIDDSLSKWRNCWQKPLRA